MLAILVALIVWTGPKGQVDHVDYLGAGDYTVGCEVIAATGAKAQLEALKADAAAGLKGRLECVAIPAAGAVRGSL